jgi:hypothetical protein
LNHLKSEGDLILKPRAGSGGYGIRALSWHDGKILVNRKVKSESDLRLLLSKLNNYIITEFIEQHDYAAALYPKTANTIRIVTMWDMDKGEPFVAFAVHRIGSNASYPVDNFSKGGFSAFIDISKGQLGQMVTFPEFGRLIWHKTHPDTDSRIEGIKIPLWNEILDFILVIAKKLDLLPYIGWDVIVTKEGFKIIEANYNTDVNLLQIHKPLLTDSRIRRFYQHHRIIRT